MIQYAPNYLGLNNIRLIVSTIIGNNGIGDEAMPQDLWVIGKNLGAPIVVHVGENEAILAGFLEAKLTIEVVPGLDDPEIPYKYWISLSRDVRNNHQQACSKAIIMAYLACNNFIEWTQPLF